jgi:hypothetical protein
MKKTFNWKVFFIVTILIITSISYDYYNEFLLSLTKNVITNTFFFYFITCVTFTITIAHKNQTGFSLSAFAQPDKAKEAISDIISALTEPCTLVCSLSILKGLFLDFFFQDSFFNRFESAEKVFLLIVSISFFIHSFLQLRKLTTELFYKVEPIQFEE